MDWSIYWLFLMQLLIFGGRCTLVHSAAVSWTICVRPSIHLVSLWQVGALQKRWDIGLWEAYRKSPPGYPEDPSPNPCDQPFYQIRRRRYRVASEGRSVAPRWPRLVARLHRSAGGIPLSFRTWSIHLSRGWPGRRFHWSLGGRSRDRSTWQRRVLCTGTSHCSLTMWPKRALQWWWMTSEIDGKLVVAATSSFWMNCCQLIYSSCLWYFMWKASRGLMSVARRVQVSAAYNRTDWTRAW